MTTQLVARAEAGLRPPNGDYSRITAEGITLHYGGPSPWPSHNPVDWRHDRCASIWRAWQAYHQQAHGWLDIAYSSGCCPHGVRYEGRGGGHRTAANGTDEGNGRSYACVYIAGVGDPLTDDAMLAVLDEQDRFGVSLRWDHGDWYPTECAGTPVRLWKQRGFPRPLGVDVAVPPLPILPPRIHAAEEDNDVARLSFVDPKGAGFSGLTPCWEVELGSGNVYVTNGARQLPALNQLAPGHPPITGVTMDKTGDGLVMFADDTRQENGRWVRSTYRVLVEP